MSNQNSPCDLVDLVRELRGSDSQVEFSGRLGIDQGDLSRFLSRNKRAGRALIVALLREFPDRRNEIVDAITRDAVVESSSVPMEVAS